MAILIIIASLAVLPAAAQSPGDLDHSFDPGAGLGGVISPLAVQPDGKVLIAGGYKHFGRLNTDGTLDDSFNVVTDGSVGAFILQPDGKMLVGCGSQDPFTTINGVRVEGVARLNPHGSLDSTFDSGNIAAPHAFALQPDGKVLIAGLSDNVQGASRNGIVRLNSDGSVDSGFDPGEGISGAMWNRILSTALQPDGKILIAGEFRYVNGVRRDSIARLNPDGSLDENFVPPSVDLHWVDPVIRSFVLQADNKIITDALSRLNPDGSKDATFNVGLGPRTVYSIALQPDGKLLVSGEFTSANGATSNGMARLNSDGSVDSTFNPGTGPLVYHIKPQEDGKALVGGFFTSFNGVDRDGLARINPDGSVDLTFDATGSGPNGAVQALARQPDGKVLIGGQFTSIQRTNRHRVARLNPDGSLDHAFDPGAGPLWERTPDQTSVQFVLQQPDGTVLIGGRFSQFDGVSRIGLARLHADGSLDSAFNPTVGPLLAGEVVEVNAAVFQSDGRILIGGDFTEVNGAKRNRIARLNADGSLDDSFDPGTGPATDTPWDPPVVQHLALQPDGHVIVTGDFNEFSGVPKERFARLNADGTLDSAFTFILARDDGNGSISTISVQPDGKMLIGGNFTKVNGVNRNRIARLHADGSLDASFDPGSGITGEESAFVSVSSVALQPDGKVLIGGEFTHFNDTPRIGIVRTKPDGSLDASFDPGTGPNNEILSMAMQPDGHVLIAGAFTAYDDIPRWRVARLHGNPPPPPLELTALQRLPDGRFRCTISGEAGGTYIIQTSADLVEWSDLEVITPETDLFGFTETTPAPTPQRFYRVKKSAQ